MRGCSLLKSEVLLVNIGLVEVEAAHPYTQVISVHPEHASYLSVWLHAVLYSAESTRSDSPLC